MLKVGFDISGLDPNFKAHAQRGIGRYVRQLHAGFLETDLKRETSDKNLNINFFDYREFLSNSIPEKLIDLLPYGRMTLKQQLMYPLKLKGPKTARFDVLHFPAHMDAPSWSSKPYIITVLDLIPLVLKELYLPDRPSAGFYFARWLERRAIINARLILAISQKTAADVVNILNVDPAKIRVTPLGIDSKFYEQMDLGAKTREEIDQELRIKYSLPDSAPLILYVGGIDQRKNIGTLLQLIAELKKWSKENNQIVPHLCLIGAVFEDRQYPLVLNKIKELGIENEVSFLGFVADQDLIPLYSIAAFFCFLSLYEGFGLPPLEAMAAGLPVIAANRSCMPEILGDAALLVDPDNLETICKKAIEILTNSDLRTNLIAKGKKRAANYTWSKTVDQTLSAYEDYAQLL
jgi:glycosyltransferase involved in cell wall biosynthesis